MRSRIFRTAVGTLFFGLAVFVILYFLMPHVSRNVYLAFKKTELEGWPTNTSRRLIPLDQLDNSGLPKDGMPAVDMPVFVDVSDASEWMYPNEPVISVIIEGTARAYPLNILLWHGVINDVVNEMPIAVTFCPLTYSSAVYEGQIEGRKIRFGVSGMLRNSNMILYDRLTHSMWQQLTGRAVIGDLAGEEVNVLISQVIPFNKFAVSYPDGKVMSRNTGFERDYGTNPYVGYDNISNLPNKFTGVVDASLCPMEKVVSVYVDGKTKAYPYYFTHLRGVVNDIVGKTGVVIFHEDKMVSPLDCKQIKNSRHIGATGAFLRQIDEYELTFSYDGEYFVDDQTRSLWDITGLAVKGKLAGKRLVPVRHLNSFAFAWLVFNPGGNIYE